MGSDGVSSTMCLQSPKGLSQWLQTQKVLADHRKTIRHTTILRPVREDPSRPVTRLVLGAFAGMQTKGARRKWRGTHTVQSALTGQAGLTPPPRFWQKRYPKKSAKWTDAVPEDGRRWEALGSGQVQWPHFWFHTSESPGASELRIRLWFFRKHTRPEGNRGDRGYSRSVWGQ